MTDKPTYQELQNKINALKKTNQQYESLFNTMTSGFILLELILDKQKNFFATKIVDVNPFFEALIGVKKNNIVGKTSEEVFSSTFLNEFKNQLDLATITKPKRVEYYYKKNDRHLEIIIYSPKKEQLAAIINDISERKRQENQIVNNENLLKTIFNGISDPIYMVNRNFEIVLMNEGFLNFQETKKEEVECQPCYKVFKKQAKKCTDCYVEEIFKDGKKRINESKITNKYGEDQYIQSVVYPVFDNQQRVNHVIEIARDVTELKKAIIALQNSEIKHRTFLQNLDGISYQTELQSFYPLFMYGKIEEITGYKAESFVNKVVTWDQIVHPDDRHMLDDRSYSKSDIGKNYEKNYRIIRKDGTIRWVHDISHYLELPENRGMITNGLIYDITERRLAEEAILESERKYRLIYENSAVGIVNASVKDFKFIDVNSKFAEIFGYSKDELYKISFAELTHPEDLEDDRQKLQKLIKGEMSSFTKEKKYYHKNGSIIWGRISVSLIKDERNKPSYFVAILEDITNRRKAEDILLKSEARLKELIATKDKFFSIIAHDLKNPFNTMLGFTELLIDNFNSYEEEKNLEIIKILNETARNSYNLLENLLEWSKTQTGLKTFHPRKVCLFETVNENIQLLLKTAKAKNIEITNDVKEELYVQADLDMLKTILRNLVSNSIKYTLPGGKIVITAERSKIANGMKKVIVSVIDNGIGIRKEDFDKLFRIDVNHTTTGTQNEPGTGLGLVICKELIDKHKGKIWVENNKERANKYKFTSGCSFKFTLNEWRY